MFIQSITWIWEWHQYVELMGKASSPIRSPIPSPSPRPKLHLVRGGGLWRTALFWDPVRPVCDKCFYSGSPMGQPDTVNQLPDHAPLLNHKFDDVKKIASVLPYNILSLGHTAFKWGLRSHLLEAIGVSGTMVWCTGCSTWTWYNTLQNITS